MLDKIREYKEEAAIASFIGILLIAGAFIAGNPASIIDSPEADFSTWYGESPAQYPEISSYTSQIGSLQIDSSQWGGFSNEGYSVGCFVNPQVTLNGQTVDDFSLDNSPQATSSSAPQEYTWDVDESRPEKTYTLEDGTQVTVGYLTAFNFEPTTFRGTYYGGDCKGVFNTVSVDFPEEELSQSINTPGNVKKSQNPEISIQVNSFSNSLRYEGTVEVCRPTAEPCTSEQITQDLDQGLNDIPVNINTDASGEYSIESQGQILVDAGTYPINNLHYSFENTEGWTVIGGNEKIPIAPTETATTFNVVEDSDNDGVYDNNDECPDTGDQGLGVKENGCPVQDDDNDGVINSADECPETWGSKTTGCPTLIDKVINVLGLRGFL